MKLEDAIKQTKPFASPYQRALVNLMYTHSWVSGEMKKHFAQYGITTKQYNILRILKGAGKPVSHAYIRERLLDRLSDVSRIIDRMTLKGWIIKGSCETDKRLVDVKLTEEGLDILSNLRGKQDKVDTIIGNLTLQEVNSLNILLDKIRLCN